MPLLKEVIRINLIGWVLYCLALPVAAASAVIKSPNDKADYEAFVLPNQLKVLAISDPNTDKAAASLAVNAGAINDPIDRQGLAHFLEHMLFLGTEKYTDAGEYQNFIRANGGSQNAFTAFEFTNYHFDIDANHLGPALDRFSQFFIAPLFTPKYVEREINSVDSEYRARLKDDARRRIYAQKSVFNPKHPFSYFQGGSLETLAHSGERSIREELLSFYKQNYSANLMGLVVLGRESLPALKEMITQRFSQVPNLNGQALRTDEPLFAPGRLPLRLDVIPNKERRSMHLMFPIPAVREHYLSKPTQYLGHILGHEGEGSLLSLLKNKGWVNGLSAGAGFRSRSLATFSISITLTEEGLSHIEEIGTHVFELLNMIEENGITHWSFEEQRKLSELGFRFIEQSEPADYVTALSTNLHVYPLADVLRGPYALDEYRPELIQGFIEYLKPKNVLLTVVAKELPTSRVTTWFETPYEVAPISDEVLSAWRGESIDARLVLPEPNPFVPEYLDMKPLADGAPAPVPLEEVAGLKLWHRPNISYGTPRANFFVSFRSPLAVDTPEHAVLTKMFVSMVNDQLIEFSYPATLAGLGYQLYPHIKGFTLRVSGYSDKQALLLERLTQTLRNPVIDAERFAIIKERQLRSLRSAKQDRPYSQTLAEISKLLLAPSWTEDQQISALEAASVADLHAFIPKLLARISIVALSHGNADTDNAIELAKVVQRDLLDDVTSVPVSEGQVVKLESGTSLVRELEVDHEDSAITIYLQGDDKEIDSRAAFILLTQILSSPFYNDLRTEKQLGYIVFATGNGLLEVPGISFVVQSPVADPAVLEQQAEEFLKNYAYTLERMSEEKFQAHKSGLLTRILDEDKTLFDLSDRYWTEIDRHHYQFDSREKLADAVSRIEKDGFVDFFRRTLLSESRKRILVRAVGNKHRKSFSPWMENEMVIPNTESFRRGKQFFPGFGEKSG